jgi:dihydrofolate reductase
MKVSAFLAVSLDGYIARPNGDIDWLEQANALVPKGEDCGFGDFFTNIDCLVMGRKSFEKVLSFPQWPYAKKPVIVLSRNGIQIPASLEESVSCSSQSPEDLCQSLSQAGMKRIYVDGGQTVRAFLFAGLLDELTVTRIPVLIRQGIPLFEISAELSNDQVKDTWFELIETRSWSFGFTQEVWKIKGKSS